MQNRFDEAMDAKEQAIRKFDADIGARVRGHYEHQVAEGLGRSAYAAAVKYVALEGKMLRESVPFIWAPDITNAVRQAAISIPNDATLDPSWLHADAGWWWFGAASTWHGLSLVHTDHGLPPTRPINALVYRRVPERNSVTMELLTTVHGEPTPGPVVFAGSEWEFGKSLHQITTETLNKADNIKRKASHVLNVGRTNYGVDYRKTDPETWATFWEANITQMFRFFAAASLWLGQRVLVEEQAQASRGARRRAERVGGTSDLRVVRLRRTEHARESEAAEAEATGERQYSCQWVVRGHWRDQYYRTTDSRRPIWIDPYVKGPDDAPLKAPKVIYTVDR